MTKIQTIILMSLLATTSTAQAGGIFLELSLGVGITKYDQPDGSNRIGTEAPLGLVRVGYQTDRYNMFGSVDISMQNYYEHISSAGTNEDVGIDVLMMGIRIE